MTTLTVLIRRNRNKAVISHPGLQQFTIEWNGLSFRYHVSLAWLEPDPVAKADFVALLLTLMPLLFELAGLIALRRLILIKPLITRGYIPRDYIA